MGQNDNSHEKKHNSNVTKSDLDTLGNDKTNIHIDGGDDNDNLEQDRII